MACQNDNISSNRIGSGFLIVIVLYILLAIILEGRMI